MVFTWYFLTPPLLWLQTYLPTGESYEYWDSSERERSVLQKARRKGENSLPEDYLDNHPGQQHLPPSSHRSEQMLLWNLKYKDEHNTKSHQRARKHHEREMPDSTKDTYARKHRREQVKKKINVLLQQRYKKTFISKKLEIQESKD